MDQPAIRQQVPCLRFVGRMLAAICLISQPTVGFAQDPDPAMRGHGGPVRALVLRPDDALVSAGFDSSIIIWNLEQGHAGRVLRYHDSTVNALVARPDNCLVSGGDDTRIAVWCDGEAAPKATFVGHNGAVSSLGLAPDGTTLVSGSWDRTVRLWLADGTSTIIAEHRAPVTGVLFSADGRQVLSAAYDGAVQLTPVAGSAPSKSLQLAAPVNGVARTIDGHYLLAGADGILREIDGEFQPVHELALPDGPLTTVAVAPDGRTIATAGMRTPVILIDRFSWLERSRILGPGLPLWALAFSADGSELFSGGADRAVRRFDTATGRALRPSIGSAGDTTVAEPKDAGAMVFRACQACHGLTAADTHLAGPTLAGIIGRRIATLPGYAFSKPLQGMDIIWTAETIARLFEIGPTAYTPGTKMPEQRITDPEARRALVDWLARVTSP